MSLFTVERSSQSSPVESSSEDGEGSDNRSRCSSVDGFWTSKNIAIFLPTQKLWTSAKQPIKGPISEHLQRLIGTLRPTDRCSLAVELEAPYAGVARYLAIISFIGVQDSEESICLGVEYEARVARVALVVPIYRDTKVKLTGDGRFTLTLGQYFYTFKPVSVQCMWATIQKLHETIHLASLQNYYHGGITHTWSQYYQARLTSDRRTLNDWAMSEDITGRPDSPGITRPGGTEDPLKARVVNTLRLVMQSVDLECATSKEIRGLCEQQLRLDLKDYRGFIDQQMLTIMGQMEQPSQVFDYLYLGSEWNASNLKELQDKGVGYVLNMTCEIDNFFPDYFHYYNVRVWDTSDTDLLKYWDETYQFIKKAVSNGSKVLVHCKMGVSRSASTVIAYAMKEYKWQLKEAMDYVKSKRDCVNPNSGFVQQLRQYEGILGARHNPVWGEKATLRKRTITDYPGPAPPAACRVSSASEDMDISGERDGADEHGGACAKGFVRTSSISQLRLSGQRPKSWAGTKREEEIMKEQNIDLYFKSMLSEEQQSEQQADRVESPHQIPRDAVPAAASSSPVAISVPSSAASGGTFAPGHRRAASAKSYDSSGVRAARRSLTDGLSPGAGFSVALLRSGSPDDHVSHTPVDDRQPSTEEIQKCVHDLFAENERVESLSQRTENVPSEGAPSPEEDVDFGSPVYGQSPPHNDDVKRRVTPLKCRGSSSSATEVLSEDVTLRMSTTSDSSLRHCAASPPSQSTSPGHEHTASSACRAEMAMESRGNGSSVTVVDGGLRGRVSVEVRPQISSVHRRVQSIERFQDFVSPAAGAAPAAASNDSADAAGTGALPEPMDTESNGIETQAEATDEAMPPSEQAMAVTLPSPEMSSSTATVDDATVQPADGENLQLAGSAEAAGDAKLKFSFPGFLPSTDAGPSSSQSQLPPSPKSPTKFSSSGRVGSRSMSVSSRRPRTNHSLYLWQGKDGATASSPPLRRSDAHSRSSPQGVRHRSFSFLSPRSQRRSSRQNEETFVTYIPTRHSSGNIQTPHFQSLLDRFRDMSRPKSMSASDEPSSSASSPTGAPIDPSLVSQVISAATEA